MTSPVSVFGRAGCQTSLYSPNFRRTSGWVMGRIGKPEFAQAFERAAQEDEDQRCRFRSPSLDAATAVRVSMPAKQRKRKRRYGSAPPHAYGFDPSESKGSGRNSRINDDGEQLPRYCDSTFVPRPRVPSPLIHGFENDS